MADVIPGQNVIRVYLDGPEWVAYVGPDPESGIAARDRWPTRAVADLAVRLVASGYVFDETWTPEAD